MKWLKRLLNGRQRPEPAPAEALAPSALEQLAQLQRDVQAIRFEWADTLDKINRWASRQAARQRLDTHRALESDATEQLQLPEAAPSNNIADLKAQLRRQAFQRRTG